MTDGFEFVDAGRKFVCSVERARKNDADAWWWFQVSVDSQHRYALFRASDDDTHESVQQRVVEFYEDMLVRRAAPVVKRWHRGGPPQQTAQPATDLHAGLQAPSAPPPPPPS